MPLPLIPILKGIGSIAKKIPYQVYVLIGLLGLVWFYGHWKFQQGEAARQAQWDKSKERGEKVLAEIRQKQLTVNMQVDTIYQERTEYVYVTGKTIVKEIPYYIPVDTPDLPAGFRVLHDAAVQMRVPSPTESVGASPVGVREATETIVNNYATCHLDRAEVLAWRQWHPEQARLWQLSHSK